MNDEPSGEPMRSSQWTGRSHRLLVQGSLAVAGPDDDVGTLVVWADGVARWVADSGDLDVWMIDDEVPYYWVC